MALKNLIPWKKEEKNVPVKYQEADPVFQLRQNVDRLFDDFFNGFGLTPFGAFGDAFNAFNPRLDVSESEQEITISAELPGLDENDFEVSLAHNVLTISGQKKSEKENSGKNYYHVERSYGSFQRAIPLPEGIEQGKVEASFKNGVLTVTMPKSAEAQKQVRKISIKSR